MSNNWAFENDRVQNPEWRACDGTDRVPLYAQASVYNRVPLYDQYGVQHNLQPAPLEPCCSYHSQLNQRRQTYTENVPIPNLTMLTRVRDHDLMAARFEFEQKVSQIHKEFETRASSTNKPPTTTNFGTSEEFGSHISNTNVPKDKTDAAQTIVSALVKYLASEMNTNSVLNGVLTYVLELAERYKSNGEASTVNMQNEHEDEHVEKIEKSKNQHSDKGVPFQNPKSPSINDYNDDTNLEHEDEDDVEFVENPMNS